jgi:hypothetical protein
MPQLCCVISVPVPASRMASGTIQRARAASSFGSAPSSAGDPTVADAGPLFIGYARVSTEDQRLDLQRDALTAAGCHRTFEDHASGARVDRPGLAAALSHLRRGDTLVVWHLDRLGRTIHQLVNLLERSEREGIRLRALQDGIDPAPSWARPCCRSAPYSPRWSATWTWFKSAIPKQPQGSIEL